MRRLLGRAPAAALTAALTTAALAAALTTAALAAALTLTALAAPRCGTAFATALATATLAATAHAAAALVQPDAAVLQRFGRVPLQRDQPVRQRPVARAGREPDRGGCQLWDG